MRSYQRRVVALVESLGNSIPPVPMTIGNQHKPLHVCSSPICALANSLPLTISAPEDELHSWVKYYWHLGFSDKDIVEHVLDHFDKSKYGLRYVICHSVLTASLTRYSVRSLSRICTSLGLRGTRQQKASFEMISPFVQKI